MSGNSTKHLPKREEIPADLKWRLEDIYETDADWEKEFATAKKLLPELTAFKGKLGDSAQNVLTVYRLKDHLLEKAERLYGYAHMRKDEDNTNPKYQRLYGLAESFLVEISTALSWLEPELMAIPEGQLQQFFQDERGLEHYRFAIEETLRMKPHILSPAEEEIVAMAGEIGNSPGHIFMMLNNADIKFPMIRDENGEEVELTKGRYNQFLESKDRRVRKDAFTALYDTYRKQINTLAATYYASVKSDVFFAKVRKFPSAREAALFPDNVPVSVFDNLIAAVHEALPEMHRYIRLRKMMLNLPELHMYDLYTPLVQDVDIKVTYDEAKKTVEEGLRPLGEVYLSGLREGFTSGWIDVMENQGKTSGAYSSHAYPVHPFVLLNYHETVDNMFTLAHEMGHAMHTYFSTKHQPYTYSRYTIFVAEVASTCNEALLMNHLLNKVQDQLEKMYLLNHYLETFRGTVFRQTMFAEFEKIVHEMVERGEVLTPEVLNEVYYGLNKTYFGSDMVVDKDIEIEWARIPHFYTAFYVYKYATGFSAATALAKQILGEGEPAVERYLNFLKSGGSDQPINLLRKAGVDMSSPEPVKEALQVFKSTLDQMEQLAKKFA